MKKEIILADILRKFKVESKAPTRIDCGGGIDHRIVSAICDKEKLQTFNIAIQLYSKIHLNSYKKGFIFVNSKEYGKKEIKLNEVTFKGKFGLIFAIASFFRVSGLAIEIETDYPLESGLGGSGSLSIALIGALIEAVKLMGQKITFAPKQIIWLAHVIEDGLYHNTGLQDQACAYYGGINLWQWQYLNHRTLFSQRPLQIKNKEIERHTCLVYTKTSHYQSHKGDKFVKFFINKPLGISVARAINNNTKFFVESLIDGDWVNAARALDKEEYLRRKFLSFTLKKDIVRLMRKARELGCGIKFAGAGGGGCLWAVGSRVSISRFKKVCQNYTKFLPLKVDKGGLEVKVNKSR